MSAMEASRRLAIGGGVTVLVLAAATAMVARGGEEGPAAGEVGSGSSATSSTATGAGANVGAGAEQAVEAEIRRQGLTPAGACPAGAPFSESGACCLFIGQDGARCSYAVGPPSSLPDRLITVVESGGRWQTASVTRLDAFVPSARTNRGACR